MEEMFLYDVKDCNEVYFAYITSFQSIYFTFHAFTKFSVIEYGYLLSLSSRTIRRRLSCNKLVIDWKRENGKNFNKHTLQYVKQICCRIIALLYLYSYQLCSLTFWGYMTLDDWPKLNLLAIRSSSGPHDNKIWSIQSQ